MEVDTSSAATPVVVAPLSPSPEHSSLSSPPPATVAAVVDSALPSEGIPSIETVHPVGESIAPTKANGGNTESPDLQQIIPKKGDEEEGIPETDKVDALDTSVGNQDSTNGEMLTSPTQMKKRNRSRDDLSLSPDLTKTGKRQRKTNILFSGFALDKKTTHVIAGNEKEEEVDEASIGGSSPANLSITSPTSAPGSSPLSSSPAENAHPASETTIHISRKEVLLTPQDAQVKAKKLPKGYAYEPVVSVTPKHDQLPPKRERKKVALADYVEAEKQSVQTAKPSKKQKINKPKKQKKPHVVQAVVTEEVSAQMLKKQELENQLNALTQQLAMVAQTLETKTKQVQALEKLETTSHEATPEVGKHSEESKEPSQETPAVEEYALPSGTIVKRITKKPPPKKAKRTSSVYDRFESDDDSPFTKKGKTKVGKKSGKSDSARPQRNRKRLSFDEEDSEEGEGKQEEEEITVAEHLQPCLKVLLRLKNHNYGWPFAVPVDPVALQIPDYLDVIKHPMDFGTILENLKANRYSTADEFGDDVRLVFKNAVTYNQPGSDICVMANSLAGIFERQFAKIGGKPPSHSTPVTKEPKPSPPKPVPVVEEVVEDTTSKTKAELASTINDLRDSMKFVREEISKLRKEKAANSPAVTKPKPPARQPKEEPVRDMTFEEKRQLSININQLPPESLGKVVQIIHQRMPNLAQNSPDEIEIDIDALDTATLRALEKYVKSVLSKKKNTPKNRSTVVPKHIQAEQTAQQTSKSISDVKKKLKELSSKSGTNKKSKKKDQEDMEDVDIDDDTPAKTYPPIEITKDKGSSSSSSSSSDSSSSSSDSSSDEGKEKKVGGIAPAVVATSSAPPMSVDGLDKPEQDQRDTVLPSPEREQASSMEEEAKELTEPSPQILEATIKKEVQLKNLGSWTNLASLDDGTSNVESQKKDETWSQFQNRDLQNKMREKEREEQQEKEKREREAREAERRKMEELRAKELAEQEQKRQQEVEEQKLAAQRELAAKRLAEKKAREEESAHGINMMEQNIVMSSFEMGMEGGIDPAQVLKLKGKEAEKETGNM